MAVAQNALRCKTRNASHSTCADCKSLPVVGSIRFDGNVKIDGRNQDGYVGTGSHLLSVATHGVQGPATEQDHALLVKAIKAGKVAAVEGV